MPPTAAAGCRRGPFRSQRCKNKGDRLNQCRLFPDPHQETADCESGDPRMVEVGKAAEPLRIDDTDLCAAHEINEQPSCQRVQEHPSHCRRCDAVPEQPVNLFDDDRHNRRNEIDDAGILRCRKLVIHIQNRQCRSLPFLLCCCRLSDY